MDKEYEYEYGIANLHIVFVNFSGHTLCFFDELKINGKSFSTKQNIDTKIPFTELEAMLGKKVCFFELIREEKEGIKGIKTFGTFQIYLGNNVAYCFIDCIGVTLELIFLGDLQSIDTFINKKFDMLTNEMTLNDKKQIFLNKIDTNNRANLILMNCDKNLIIESEDDVKLSIYNLINSLNQYQNTDGYQFCFSIDNLNKFLFKKIEAIEELDFDGIYNTYYGEVDKLYKELTENLHPEISNELSNKLSQTGKDLTNKILKRKYIYPTSYLEKKINNDKYIDFISEMVLISSIIEESKIGINSEDIKQFEETLLINKKKINSDNRLKIYEKVFLLIYIYKYSLLRIGKDFILRYIIIDEAKENSPIKLCFDFLNNFAINFSETSDFFYPLLCIDSGLFNYKWIMCRDQIFYIHSFGFDMCSANIIKNHLIDSIPRLLILEDDLGNIEATTCEYTGMIALNMLLFTEIKEGIEQVVDINDDSKDKEKNERYGFMLLKILFHETFGHKKSGLSKNNGNFSSAKCFKDRNNNLRLVYKEYIEDQYFALDKGVYTFKKDLDGESGSFLEFFLGEVFGIATIEIIDKLQNDTSLGFLMDYKLWHNGTKTITEYIKLKFFIINNNIIYDNDKNLPDIYAEIEYMKNLIEKHGSNSDLDNKIKMFYEKQINDGLLRPFERDDLNDDAPKLKFKDMKEIDKKGRINYLIKRFQIKKNSSVYISEIIEKLENHNLTHEEYEENQVLIKSLIFKK